VQLHPFGGVFDANGAISARGLLEHIAWTVLKQATPSFDANVEATAAFCAEHGRRPSRKAKGPEEKRLGEWLGGQRKADRKGNLGPARKALLDEKVPGWDESFDDIYAANVDATAAFCAEHGRWPSAMAKGPEEKRLGRWLSTQRVANKKGNLSPARKALLDEKVPGWDAPR
jgi:hypothetical protein